MLLPALGKTKELGTRIACLSNVKQWGVALLSYAADNNENGPCNLDGQRAIGSGHFNSLVSLSIKRMGCADFLRKWDTIQKKKLEEIAPSTYSCIFGRAAWMTGSGSWYGWHRDSAKAAYSQAAPCPNLRLLGTRHTYESTTWTFPNPARQPIFGDGADSSITEIYIYPRTYPLNRHGYTRNVMFADGHAATGSHKNATLIKTYIYCTIFYYPN